MSDKPDVQLAAGAPSGFEEALAAAFPAPADENLRVQLCLVRAMVQDLPMIASDFGVAVRRVLDEPVSGGAELVHELWRAGEDFETRASILRTAAGRIRGLLRAREERRS